MNIIPTVNKDKVVILVKAGRLQSWDFIDLKKQESYIKEHVELIKETGYKYGIQRLESFKLINYQQPWHRLWVIEFPTFEGAEAWIESEMAPPYGSHGYWEYYLARPWGPDYFSKWPTKAYNPINRPIIDTDENTIPALEINENNNFYVKTLNDLIINSEIFGYIMVTEQANEILIAVDERKNFILKFII